MGMAFAPVVKMRAHRMLLCGVASLRSKSTQKTQKKKRNGARQEEEKTEFLKKLNLI
jgi:hypothetical protein